MIVVLSLSALILLTWVLLRLVHPEVHPYASLQAPPDYLFAETQHGPTAYRLFGPKKGPLMVFVHGFGTPSVVFDDLIPELVSEGYRILSFDFYGRGYSARPKIDYTVAAHEEQLDELLHTIGIRESFYLVGLSLGGTVASAFTAKHPTRVRKLLLMAPMLGPVDVGPIKYPLVGAFLTPLIARKFPERQMRGTLHPERYPELRSAIEEQLSVKDTTQALVSAVRNVVMKNHRAIFERVGQFRIPTLLLWGNEDPVLPYDDHLEIQELTNAKFKGILSTGHLICLEKPDYVAAKFLEFLEEEEPLFEAKALVGSMGALPNKKRATTRDYSR